MAFEVEFGIVSVPLPNTTTGFRLSSEATGRSSRYLWPIGMRIRTAPIPTSVDRRQWMWERSPPGLIGVWCHPECERRHKLLNVRITFHSEHEVLYVAQRQLLAISCMRGPGE